MAKLMNLPTEFVTIIFCQYYVDTEVRVPYYLDATLAELEPNEHD